MEIEGPNKYGKSNNTCRIFHISVADCPPRRDLLTLLILYIM